MISVDEALAAYEQLPPLPLETLAVSAALHRVLATDGLATWDLPRHSQSALDGYVLCAADAQAGTALNVAGTIAAGDTRSLAPLAGGQAQRIFTGARVPADATPENAVVVAQERVRREDTTVTLHTSLKPGANIRWQGEEARAGTVVARTGQRLTPGLVASLLTAGVAELAVRRSPRITVLVSGDELKPAGSPLATGQIWDSNGPLVRTWLQGRGYGCTLRHLPDDLDATRKAIGEALASSDVVISTGGVSVGEKDFIIPAAEALGVQRQFWRVAQKPGKPLYFGTAEAGRKALLGLPGNPGAVLVGLTLHLRKLLDVLEGASTPGALFARGVLTAAVQADAQRERLLRMRLEHDAEGRALLHPLPHQDSHMLSNLDAATVLVRLPLREHDYSAGEVLLWTPL